MTDDNFSIIIPTLCEAKNLTELITRIANLDFGKRQFEVLIVDDNSQDGTIEIVQDLKRRYDWLNLIVRNSERSLSQSVITGFNNAKYPLLVSMDADLSHPPEKIPEMLRALSEPDIDFVIGSRYVKNAGIDEVWPFIRKIISKTAVLIARLVLHTSVQDPLSGFFAITRSKYLACDSLKPIGWKIGLEIMVKGNCKKIREIPITFSERKNGSSKLNRKAVFSYLQHIKNLFFYKISTLRNKN